MRPLLTAVAGLLIAISMTAPAAAADLLSAIDHAHRMGEIDDAQRLIYRVAAIRAPQRIPDWLRRRGLQDARPGGSRTAVMVEAFQALPTLSRADGWVLRDLLAPPPDLSNFVETTSPFPMRVSFDSPSLQAKAERVLQAAITSYEKEVQQWGFWEPPIEEGLEQYRFYVMDAAGAAGYTAPYLEVDSTDHYDSYSYIVIDPTLSDLSLDATVAHEFNHACQIAMDVGELRAFMENTASYIEAKVFPASAPMMSVMFPYFQSQPYRALEYMRLGDSDLFEYGGALWALFLTHQYGADDPAWLRQVWERSIQQDWQNEPDYFDALDEMLESEGGFREAVRIFAEHRYFVGNDDDGKHLPHASTWAGAEVWRTLTIRQTQLPAHAGPQSTETRPEPNGCNYVVVDLDVSAELPLRVTFDGDESALWDVSIVSIGQAGATSRDTVPLDEQQQGELAFTPSEAEQLLLIMCHLPGPDYDPDDDSWVAADYTYRIEHDLPVPTIDEVTPAELVQGTSDNVLTIRGSNFNDYPGLRVALSGTDLITTVREFVSTEELTVNVIVPRVAATGARDVLLFIPGAPTAVGEKMVTVVAPPVEPDEPPTDQSDESGCSTSPGPPRGWHGWLGLLGVSAVLRRRRSRPRRG